MHQKMIPSIDKRTEVKVKTKIIKTCDQCLFTLIFHVNKLHKLVNLIVLMCSKTNLCLTREEISYNTEVL